MYYSETLGKTITNKVWRIVRIGARPEWHIYGISKKDYHKRMKDEGFLTKEAETLIKDFKQNKIVELINELRKFAAKIIIKCCRDGNVVYVPMDKPFEIQTIVNKDVPIDKWKSEVILTLTEHINETGEDKCQNMSSSLYLCKPQGYEIKNIKITRKKVI